MALTYTPSPDLGQPMPAFTLSTVFGETFSSDQELRDSKATVVAFICAHCPYVQAVESRLIDLARKIKDVGGKFVAICSNDPTEYPEDAPEALAARAKEKGYTFPYLVDETQEVARKFGAVCTPDFFVYDRKGTLRYRGRLDDSWKDPAKVTREELWQAVRAIAEDKPIPGEQIPSMGCSIKWRNEC